MHIHAALLHTLSILQFLHFIIAIQLCSVTEDIENDNNMMLNSFYICITEELINFSPKPLFHVDHAVTT